jgi:high affinity Mn2+ porin
VTRALAAAALLVAAAARAEEGENASLHYQATVATQYHPAFDAKYSGQNSLQADEESATSVVMDLFGAARAPWKGGEIYIQPELAGGRGLSSTLGVAAFPSGEVYRVGNPTPAVILAQLFLRQTFELGGEKKKLDGGPGQLAGVRDSDALVITAGKMATTNVFDIVPVSSDPHTRFMSWGLWASAAYDYPADTHGYTYGAAADLSLGNWSFRAGIFLEPKSANGNDMELNILKARGIVGEVEWRFPCGAVRALGFHNTAHMGNYDDAIALNTDIVNTRADGRTKAGAAASANCDFTPGLSGFVRGSFNDGQNETWAFTEIDRSLAAGVVQAGALWGRPDDEAGAAAVVSGISGPHRQYLAIGQYGFLIGDGALQYGAEVLGEIYYRFSIIQSVSFIGTWQPILNPAYNRSRGPVNVLTIRAHVAF